MREGHSGLTSDEKELFAVVNLKQQWKTSDSSCSQDCM